MSSDLVDATALRAAFARSLSALYGAEVPAYTTLVQVAHEVNTEVAQRLGPAAQRLGSLDRVTAERHGAIRVGTAGELRQLATVFAAMGMHPTGYYDLREAAPAAVPVVSNAFRPIEAEALAANPFRVFTSVLAVADRRFFSADLAARLQRFLDRRMLFPPQLLTLAEQSIIQGGLPEPAAHEFLQLATDCFAMSTEPVDRAWYTELEQVSAVAADIGGVASTHINHLTPRVLDIDELYVRMSARGITMIDEIQGPPRNDTAPVLLRQTSFRALNEGRRFLEPDGIIREGHLRVRFGEVEARGVALTPKGRARYDEAMQLPTSQRQRRWSEFFPDSEQALFDQGLGYYELREGRREPIVYEDFLPASAAGIFQSNLSEAGNRDNTWDAATLDADWVEGSLNRKLHDPYLLYQAQQEASLR